MFPPQVSEQFIPVQVPHVTVLAERMATMGFIVHVSLSVVQGKIRAIVTSSFEGEDLQVVRAKVAVEHLMFSADVLLQQFEGYKVAVVALGTGILQELVEGILD